MSRHVLAFQDYSEVSVERSGAGELLVHARVGDRAIDALGLGCFARPTIPGAEQVTLAGVPVPLIRMFAREHGGVEPTWTDKAAIEILKAAAAAEAPWQPSPDIPDDPPDIAEVLRRPREAAPPAAPFRGTDAPVSGARAVHDAPALRALATDPVMACLEEARGRFLEELVRPIEPPTDPIYARHWSPARGWRAKVSSLRIIAEALAPALEPEHAGHPRQADIQALRARIAETSVKWRTEAMNAEGNRRAA